jgi:UDP-glucuronate 4-epimerase
MKVLVTGAAGFIGYHVARRLAGSQRCEVLGVDVIGDYYDPALKHARLAELAKLEDFRFVQGDFADAEKFSALVAHFKPAYVVHLGAQPGVRYSIEKPAAYTHSNLDGFASVLEACRRTPPKHLVFASSSSVYGAGARAPFREDDNTDQPVSFYGATKKANEVIAHSYAHVHGLNLTGLRFFTVYGPWGRPDMAPTLFARAICEGTPLKLFNGGKNLRDFTYIDDIVDGIVKVLLYPPAGRHVAGPHFQSGPPPAGRNVALRQNARAVARQTRADRAPPAADRRHVRDLRRSHAHPGCDRIHAESFARRGAGQVRRVVSCPLRLVGKNPGPFALGCPGCA